MDKKTHGSVRTDVLKAINKNCPIGSISTQGGLTLKQMKDRTRALKSIG
jgi:hypothetical protein